MNSTIKTETILHTDNNVNAICPACKHYNAMLYTGCPNSPAECRDCGHKAFVVSDPDDMDQPETNEVQWIITYAAEDGESKPKRIERPIKSIHFTNKTACPYHFKLYTDDNDLIYEGFCSDNDSEDAFAPLDDYGMPNFGCSYIQYKQPDGTWETL